MTVALIVLAVVVVSQQFLLLWMLNTLRKPIAVPEPRSAAVPAAYTPFEFVYDPTPESPAEASPLPAKAAPKLPIGI